jgi:gamma-glutamyltranspeptidase
MPGAVFKGLAERGHQIERAPAWSIASEKVLMVEPTTGALLGAADPRREGYAVGW